MNLVITGLGIAKSSFGRSWILESRVRNKRQWTRTVRRNRKDVSKEVIYGGYRTSITYPSGLSDLASALVDRGLPESDAQRAECISREAKATEESLMADPISKSAGRFVTFGQGRFVLRWGQHQCYALFNPTKDVARTSDRVKKYGKVVVGYFPTLREGLAAAVLASFAADNRTINYRELNQFLRQLCQQILSDARWDQQKAIPSTAAGGIANHNEELASTPF